MASKLLQDLPAPPKENLSSHFILGEIIDHIDHLQDEFPHVQIPLLRSHLWDIRNKNVDPESHLRGFLKVFEHTPVFKEAFEQLDEGLRTQIRTFIAGGSESVVLAAGGKGDAFHVPPSPPVKHHFRELREKLEKLFHHEKHEANGTNGDLGKKGVVMQGYPRIFEDEKESKIMEVSLRFLFFPVLHSKVKFWLGWEEVYCLSFLTLKTRSINSAYSCMPTYKH